MTAPAESCALDRRREDVRQAALYGIDFVEVGASQTTLEVYFLGKAPPDFEAANVSITGGRSVTVTGIRINRQADPAFDDWLEVDVDQPGDGSAYTLAFVTPSSGGAPMPGFDPLFASAVFSFKASCPSGLDCCTPQVCPPPARPRPDIDYLAKDYDSFRQLMLDRLALTMPDWRETHVPDIGVMLVELLAYAGDQLSYFQDAVATEAYLNTARLRVSLRRHARLVDYAMHEGCNARAWLTIAVGADTSLDLGTVGFCTAIPGAAEQHVLSLADLAQAPPGSFEWFEPLWPDRTQTIALRAAHNEIRFYTWGDCACCLPVGTTRATLLDQWVAGEGDGGKRGRALDLHEKDVLIFEEAIGPHTGSAADANPLHRQAVRLTQVTQVVDELYDTDAGGRPLVEIEWCSEDALTFPLCLSAVMPAPDCTCRDGISVARGNVILMDSGASTGETLDPVPTQSTSTPCPTDCESPVQRRMPPLRYRPCLKGIPLTFAQLLADACCASDMIAQDPRQAVPAVVLQGAVPALATPPMAWTAVPDLLESGPDDRHFVVETDDDGVAHLRFGNDAEGRRPDAGTVFTARYRVGNGPDGNVGAEAITCLVLTSPSGITTSLAPRNPLPATGGTAPETADDVRMFAPNAFRSQLERAITASDYATLASDNARRLAERAPQLCGTPFRKLQNAKATLCWNGSWYEVRLALDPLGSETVDDELLDEIDAYLAPYRRIGYDLRASAPDYVPLDLGVSVCVMPGYQRAHVKAALLAAFGTGSLPDGRLALFNPDNQTFGQGVFVSHIVAAAQAIPGVMETQVTRLAPYVPGTPAPSATPDEVPASSVLALGPYQIARLDNDPNAPVNGRLTLLLRGGR